MKKGKKLRITFVLTCGLFFISLSVTPARAFSVLLFQISGDGSRPKKEAPECPAETSAINNERSLTSNDDDPKKNPVPDERVIVETRTEIIEETVNDCNQDTVVPTGIPGYAYLGLGPLGFLLYQVIKPDDISLPPDPVPASRMRL